jgi:hypothetical protein
VGTPSPRGTESTLAGRVSAVRNVTTPSRSGHSPVGRPRGRLNSSAGTGWSKKRMPVAERRQETRGIKAAPFSGRLVELAGYGRGLDPKGS